MNYSKVKTGVYICHCGTNISSIVDIDAVTNFAIKLEGVSLVRDHTFMCSNPGQDLIMEDIRQQSLNRVVVASCSPLMHEATFRRVCSEAGLNPFFIQMANIREQCSWVVEDGQEATCKAKCLVAAAVNRVHFHQERETRQVNVAAATLILGGGIVGIEAALKVADSGKQVFLVERESSIGGHMAKLYKTFPTMDCSA